MDRAPATKAGTVSLKPRSLIGVLPGWWRAAAGPLEESNPDAFSRPAAPKRPASGRANGASLARRAPGAHHERGHAQALETVDHEARPRPGRTGGAGMTRSDARLS